MQEPQVGETTREAPEIIEIGFKRPGFWSVQFALLFASLVLAAVAYYVAAWSRLAQAITSAADYAPHLIVPLTLCGAALLVRFLVRPRRVPPLVFHPRHFLLPRTADSSRVVLVAYDDICSVDLRGSGATERLLIGTRGRLFIFPRPAFASPNGIEQALRELYQHILRLPQGSRIVERIAQSRRQSILAMSKSTVATQSILALFAVFFVVQYSAGGFSTALGQVRFGALTPVLVRSGEAYRLLSSSLLHANVLHLYLDALALFFLGAIAERLLGRTRFVLVFVISALGGALASASTSPTLFSVGGSSGIFGLLGALAVIDQRFRGELPFGFAQPLRWWAGFLAALGLLTAIVPEVDGIANLTALFCGVAVTLLVVDMKAVFDPNAAVEPALRYTAGGLAAVYGVTAIAALGLALHADERHEVKVARRIVEAAVASPNLLNELAWRVAVQPTAKPELLDVALAAAERAVAVSPEHMQIVDTLAAVYYRLGRQRDAVTLERRVLAATGEDFAAEHLAQFLRALAAAAPPEITLDVQTTTAAASGADPRVEVRLAHALTGVTQFFALGLRGDRVVALLVGTLPSASPAGAVSLTTTSLVTWPRDARYELVLVDSACETCPATPPTLNLWNLELPRSDLP